ncbi:hypothetical protein ACIQ8G_25865 [Streptomyces sp. NPDC094154]|uniref:hypothetical protein n=1 Tax=Streptomyces sp. NPDC094154 TaxID=3366059 RepID=UPI003815AC8F
MLPIECRRPDCRRNRPPRFPNREGDNRRYPHCSSTCRAWDIAARAVAYGDSPAGRDVNDDARELMRLSLALNASKFLAHSDYESLQEILHAYHERSQ